MKVIKPVLVSGFIALSLFSYAAYTQEEEPVQAMPRPEAAQKPGGLSQMPSLNPNPAQGSGGLNKAFDIEESKGLGQNPAAQSAGGFGSAVQKNPGMKVNPGSPAMQNPAAMSKGGDKKGMMMQQGAPTMPADQMERTRGLDGL